MDCPALLFLLLASLAPAAAKALRPAVKAPGRSHLSNPTSHHAVARNYSVHYFQQKLDHFGFNNRKTFKQRYLIADTYWKRDGGSILFYTGNEGDIIWLYNNTGFMWDVAEELKAMLVFAEHRYYGESLPFGDDTFQDSRNLNFLTSEQALSDFAVLIKYLQRTIPGAKNQPVIAIGGSYGGMLAAWFRMKYPHIVVGALAASAPIWQFYNLVPCGKFMRIVTKDFERSGPNCSESIKRSWAAINRFSHRSSGLQWLTEALHLCSPLTFEDVQRLKDWISEIWVNLAMVDYPYQSNFLQPLPAWPIKIVCQYLKDLPTSDSVLLQNIFQALNIYYNYSGQAKCLNISETARTNYLGSLGWSYQSCTEMVIPICSNGIDDMFEPHPWNLKEFSDECFKLWGVRPRPFWITTMYGGRNISSHSNIIFSNGELDPWSGGGVTKDITDTLVAITILEGAHHLDLRAKNAFDPPSVLLARDLEVKYLKRWIRDFYDSHRRQY